MKRIYNKTALRLFIPLFMLLLCQQVGAQCNNLTLTLTRTNSTCLANGSIKVTVGGADAVNIRQSDMQFQVSGDKDLAFASYANHTIENLPAGTYTITLKAFCNTSNDWIIATTTATTTITSTYREMNFTFSRVIPTLNCRATGIARLFIESGTGSPPFIVEMTSWPSGYSGSKTFTTSSRIDSIKNLAAGNYTFKVSDNCGYTISDRNITVGTMSQDYYNIFNQYLYQPGTTANACNLVSAYRQSPSSGTDPDGYFYFHTNSYDFFEVAFVFNDSGTKTWQPLTNSSHINLTLPSPYTLKSMRAANAYYAVYLRVKGCTVEHKLTNLSLRDPVSSYLAQTATGCDTVNLNFYTYSNYNTTICFPYQWRLLRSDNTVVYDWHQTDTVYNRNTHTAKNVPIGSLKMEFRDSEGYIWSNTITTTSLKPSLQTAASYSYAQKEPDGVYRTYMYPYFHPSLFPVGTTFKFLPESGATPPANLTGSITTASTAFYPYSAPPFNTVYAADYVRLNPALYRFQVTRPGCTPDTIQTSPTIYKLQSDPVYELVEECDGLLVTFKSGGQMEYSYWNTGTNAVITYTTGTPHIRIGSGPSGDQTKIVPHGGSLKLPLAGTYYIYLYTSNNSSTTVVNRDTIVYDPTPFTLDNAVTSAYLCQGELTGFIRVKGTGGAGGYKYQLYDNGSPIITNTTGVFNYGVGGGTYTVVLSDTICGYSYPQDVTLIDLGIAQIAYSSSPDNKFCTVDSIYLKCLTLGQTTYTWTGPGINTVNTSSPSYKNKQNPVIAASDIGVGTHTFTITVTPESCGTQMTQTVTIIVEDCDGARDDYHTMLKNTTDSVNILANDGFPSSCAASVTPVITAIPTKGTATIVNKKVVYTPTADFVGKDSLTYSTVCSGTTTTAKVYFNVMSYPGNIVDSSACTIPFDPIVFDVKRAWYSPAATAHGQTGALVGDLDGDGVPEIITISSGLATLNVLNGSTGTVKYSMTIAAYGGTGGWYPVSTGVLVDSDRNGMGELIFASSDNKLTSYEADTTGGVFTLKQKWQTTFVTPTGSADNRPQPIVADFNGDGTPEAIVYNQIYNAKTGALLGQTEAIATAYTGRITNRTSNNQSNFQTAIDFDGDGLPEIAAGGKIYKVTVNAAGTAVACSILYQTTAFGDGFTSVADVDLDGNMDVVVIDYNATDRTRINVWSPKDNRVIDQISIPNSSTAQGYAFIGDIDGVVSSDGKRYPEICVTTTRSTPTPVVGRVSAYKYNATTQKYVHKWDLINTDTSGGTGITLFDFNNDGINELVYRDQSYLYILNGVADNTAPILASANAQITCTSGTAFEYPVIADLDGSGSAKICVTCTSNGVSGVTHTLNAFESATSPWAPTRKVWNQVNYEPTGINDDLTVPVYLFPKNYTFNVGMNKYWPFNGALIQIPITDSDLNPVVNAADPYVASVSSAFPNDTTVRVSVVIGNYGVMNTNAGLPIALYIESIAAANLFEVKPIGVALAPGNTTTLHYDIPTDKAKNQIYIRIQDDGTAYPASGSYTDCDYSNNTGSGITVIAVDDNVFVRKGKVTVIKVLSNDFLGSCDTTSITLTIETSPANGTVTVVGGNKLQYTPTANFEGSDSLKYKITCGGISDDAMVFMQVKEFPDNIIEADCYTDPPAGVWSFKQMYTSVEGVFEMSIPLVGDIDSDGSIEIVCAGTSIVTSNFSADTIKIFDAVGKRLKHKFPTERFHAGFGTIAMADVDGDGYAEIFVATAENATAGNQGYIYCYKYDGTFKWKSNQVYTTDVARRAFPYLNITDFNGDGIPEIMANDRIFNAQNGQLLLDCGLITGALDYGTGAGHTSYYGTQTGSKGAFSSAVDMDNDGHPELVAGRNIYKIKLNSLTNPALNTCTILLSVNSTRSDLGDGYTSVADLNLDGTPDVVVVRYASGAYMYAWDGKTGDLLNSNVVSVAGGSYGGSIPFLGDLDGDGIPEIAFCTASRLNAYKYNQSLGTITTMSWSPLATSDGSASTTLTLFDFDQDKKMELVYRDMSNLRIIDGTTGVNKKTVACFSWTMNEYPVVADVDGDGYANIVVLGKPASASHGNGYLYVFESDLSVVGANPWAPARKVWNQWGYNAVNINEDLTVPKLQLNPATVFPGDDGSLGTADDVRPYNGFLMQQTMLNVNGTPIWLTPDVYPVSSLTSSSIVGDSVSITIGMVNQGDASIGSPIYVSLYKETLAAANRFATDSGHVQINPGDTGYVTVRIPNIYTHLPILNIVVRVNDNGSDFTDFTYQTECDDTNNVMTIINPVLSLMMKKEATLLLSPPVPHNGTHPNPVSVLHNEDIEYTITAVNANQSVGKVIIRDTLPAYLQYRSSTPTVVPTTVSGNPSRIALEWTINGVASMATTSVKVVATPEAGCVSSQPMFINGAWVLVSDSIYVPTNYTYHQGACIGVATFSAGFGGNIYNAVEQALDYKTKPRSGIVIVPDEGYRFAGWSHEDYLSLRSEPIKAQSGIMHYDTLTVYGNMNLHANFELEEYAVHYHLNGGENASSNPLSYTIQSGAIALAAPEKSGDVFLGWTGSNGEKPQQTVVIAEGSTGELEYFANFLYSGREEENPIDESTEDKIWSAENELFIRTSKIGSMVRIYSTEGVLQHQQVIVQTGETKIRLPQGLYIVTLDDHAGKKVKIE